MTETPDRKRLVAFLRSLIRGGLGVYRYQRPRLGCGCISFPRMLVLAIALASGTMASRAQQKLVTFDDLPGSTNAIALPSDYAGFHWENFGYLGPLLRYGAKTNGYHVGMISPGNVAYNIGALTASITSTAPFDLVSAYLTSAWNDNLQVEVLGYVGSTLTYSNLYLPSATTATLITFNYLGVDTVSFRSFGGTPHPSYHGTGEQFAMDNLTLAVPEPSSGALVILGATLLLARCARRQNNG